MDWYYADESDNQIQFKEEELASLIESGTIIASTLVWNESMADWQACSAIRPELFGGEALPPALTASQRKQAGLSPGDTTYKPPTDSMAVCALVFGALGLLVCMPLGLGGVICGHIARKRAKEGPPGSANAGLALAGLITGYLGLALGLVIAIVYGAVIAAAIASEM